MMAREVPEFRYRNKHTDDVVTIVGAPMLADALYRDDEPWGEDEEGNLIAPSRHRLTFGLAGRDGFFFLPQHWVRVG